MREEILSRLIATVPPAADHRLAYGSGIYRFGDLCLPRLVGPHPVVIAIHGGNWKAEYDLTHFSHFCAALSARGLATWSIEYRRIGHEGGGWPGTFLDAAAGADFVRELAPRFDLDLTRVVVVGHSAGGHLALWLAGRAQIPPADPLWTDAPLVVRGVVSLAGVGDLRRRWDVQGSASMVAALMGALPSADPSRYGYADASGLLPLGTRQVLIHGTADHNVPVVLAEEYRDRAVATGDDVILIKLPGVGHFELIDPLSAEFETVAQAIETLLG